MLAVGMRDAQGAMPSGTGVPSGSSSFSFFVESRPSHAVSTAHSGVV
jgi:hypothetical protein